MRAKLLFISGLLLLSPLYAAMALSINQVSQLVVFGDSLSDTGNASIATAGLYPGSGYDSRSVPGLPYSIGEYTNPPVAGGPAGLWVEQFAALIGQPNPQPYLLPGSAGMDYAVGSADTGSNGSYFVSDQVGIYLSNLSGARINGGTLFTFWAGANDITDGANPVTAADNIFNNIRTLAAAGGQNFIWLDLPDLGKSPQVVASGQSAAATAASNAFNAEYARDVALLQAMGINVIAVDVNSLFNAILASPSTYGFTNVTGSALGTPGANPDDYVFFDGYHPTTAVNRLVAEDVYADVTAPEPASIALAGLGFLALLTTLKLRRKAPAPSRS